MASYQREIINRKLKDFPNRYIWNDKSSEDFTKGFLNPNIKNKLDNFLKDEINLTTSDIKATNDLYSVIQQVEDLTLRKKSKNKRKKTQNEKWFDQDLHKKKKQVKDKDS